MMIQEEKNKLLTEFKGLASKLQKLKDGEQDNLVKYEKRRNSFNTEKPKDPSKVEFQKQVIVQLEKLNDKYQTLEKKMTDVHKQPKSMENSVATRKSHGDSQRRTHHDKEKERSRSKSKEKERQKKKYLTGNSEIESLTDRSGYIKKPDEEFARLKKESEDDLMRLISSQGAFEESERKSKRKKLDRSEEKNRQKEKSAEMQNLMKREQELKIREQEANKREEHLKRMIREYEGQRQEFAVLARQTEERLQKEEKEILLRKERLEKMESEIVERKRILEINERQLEGISQRLEAENEELLRQKDEFDVNLEMLERKYQRFEEEREEFTSFEKEFHEKNMEFNAERERMRELNAKLLMDSNELEKKYEIYYQECAELEAKRQIIKRKEEDLLEKEEVIKIEVNESRPRMREEKAMKMARKNFGMKENFENFNGRSFDIGLITQGRARDGVQEASFNGDFKSGFVNLQEKSPEKIQLEEEVLKKKKFELPAFGSVGTTAQSEDSCNDKTLVPFSIRRENFES